MNKIPPFDTLCEEWYELLKDEISKPYVRTIIDLFNKPIMDDKVICPDRKFIFEALNRVPFDKIKVVILGQDPYPNPKHSNGLAFGVNKNVNIPNSLMRIFKELETDITGFKIPPFGDLNKWVDQGVLLLNSVLTTISGIPGAHKDVGWDRFTDSIIKLISDNKNNVVFILWGNLAIKKENLIDIQKHHIITGGHPSPINTQSKFLGGKYFSRTNEILKEDGIKEIDWKL